MPNQVLAKYTPQGRNCDR